MREIEYESAVGYGVARAIARGPTGDCSLRTYACHLAIFECYKARRFIRKFPGPIPKGLDFAARPDIPLEGPELLEFVAAVGRKSAAAILMVSKTKLRDLIDVERRNL